MNGSNFGHIPALLIWSNMWKRSSRILAKNIKLILYRPTVSPNKNSLVYFISIVYTDHHVWRSHREEAKRGPPSGHRITRNGAAMVSLLLPYATTGLSRIAGRCLIGATPRGQ